MNLATNAVWKLDMRLGMAFEARLFQLAEKMLEGYANGSWSYTAIGDFWLALPPSKDTVTIRNANGTFIVNKNTAGAILHTMAFNKALEDVMNDLPNSRVCRLADVFSAFQSTIFNNAVKKGIDTAALEAVID